MKITNAAAEAIVNVMKTKGLDPKKFCLEIGVFDGNLGLGFTNEMKGKTIEFGELRVVINRQVDSNGVTVDYGEVKGTKGLIFLGEQNGRDQIDRASDS
jgi:hypothetical protein